MNVNDGNFFGKQSKSIENISQLSCFLSSGVTQNQHTQHISKLKSYFI